MTFDDARRIPTQRIAEALGLGRGRRFRCPLADHGEIAHYAPVTVSRRTNRWYCPLCKKGGDGPHLVAVTLAIPERDALAWIALQDWEGATFTPSADIEDEDALLHQAPIYEAFLAQCPLSRAHEHYLRGRGISGEAIELGRLASAPTYADLCRIIRGLGADENALINTGLVNAEGHPRFYKHTLLFPVVVDGRVRGITARRMDDADPRYLAAFQRQFLYGVDLLADHFAVALCEGAMDTLTLWTERVPAVGILGVEAFAYNLASFWAPLRGRQVILGFDQDEAGQHAVRKLVRLLPAFGVLPVGVLDIHPGYKDVNEEHCGIPRYPIAHCKPWEMRDFRPFVDLQVQ